MGRIRASALAGAMTLAGLLAVAGDAAAAVYTATYTGQVRDVWAEGSIDYWFGDLAEGGAFTAVFRWDEADAGAGSYDLAPDASVYSGPMTTDLTIGGVVYGFGADAGEIGQLDGRDGGNSVITHGFVQTYFTSLRASFQIYTVGGSDLVSSWDWRVPGTYDLTGSAVDGAFSLVEFGTSGILGSTGGLLRPTSLVVAREGGGVTAVPEPGAWALMILGFGAAGAMLRRRRARGRDFSPRVHISPPRSK